jgi:hypothetical protein
MPYTHEAIARYSVAYYAGGATANGYQYRAIIGLRRADGSLLGGAYFHRDPSTMPDTDTQTASGYHWLHYRSEDFERILDILRNEKPCYLRYVDGWSLGSINTSTEPVGEEEGLG